ncbi:MAG: amidase [Mycobacteriaceae bacterium]
MPNPSDSSFQYLPHKLPTLINQVADLAAGKISSVELTRQALSAAEASQSTLNAFKVLRKQQALTEAAEADRRLASGERLGLLGVPIAVKDDIDIQGLPTAFGCQGNFPEAKQNSAVVTKLQNAGAIIIGKTNSPELGQWPLTSGPGFGVTRNPWSSEHTPGGSSGGSAAAVSSGIVSAAIGSDGAGSIRIPAAWTNLVGIKPQRGRISTWPEAEAFNGITVFGPLARTVADAALLLDITSGAHTGDLHTPPALTISRAVGQNPGKLRIALSLKAPFSLTLSKAEFNIAAATYRMADQLRKLGHSVTLADPRYGIGLGMNFLPRSLSGIYHWHLRMADYAKFDHRTLENARSGKYLAGWPLHVARASEPRLANRVGKIFNDFDVILAPTTATTPLKATAIDGQKGWATDKIITKACPYTWPWNVLGWPSVSIPAGFSPEGLPIGVQLMGYKNTESLLVSLAAQIESVAKWHHFQPKRWW